MLTKIKTFLATLYGKMLWNNLVKKAERLHRTSRTHAKVYVINHPFHPKKIMYIDRAGFRKFKDTYKIPKKCTLDALAKGAWYYTANNNEENGLSIKDRKARRILFIRSVVEPYK